MRNENRGHRRRTEDRRHVKFGKIMNCFRSGDQLKAGEMFSSSESLATKDYTTSLHSSRAVETKLKADKSNIEEAESTLRESGTLNYEEARALLGRYEFQKGNIEAALHVFEGIDIASVTPKIKITLAKRGEPRRRSSQNYTTPLMSIHAVSLLLESILLKAKSLQALGRFKEAAQSCTVILDVVESSLPAGLPETFGADSKLQEIVSKAVELLPELWKISESSSEAITSYRRALLHHWNLDPQTTARIQKDFAIFLLYSGGEVNPPNLRSQMDSSFVPRNNTEEAILLLMILLKKVSLNRIEWDPTILDHLTFALSIAGGLQALAKQIEELFPGNINRKDTYDMLALCYHGEGDNTTALNLLKKLLHYSEDPAYVPGLLLASKISVESSEEDIKEATNFAHRGIGSLQGRCDSLIGVANVLLGVSLSAHARSVVTDAERVRLQAEALQSLELAGKMTSMNDANTVYHLCLENAEQRKLDTAVYYAKCLLKLESGSTLKGWLLLARILSAQQLFSEAEDILNAALEQTGKWDQGVILRTKAKLQLAQFQTKNAIETYSQLLAILRVQSKSIMSRKHLGGAGGQSQSLELETWHDLASIYIKLSCWRDAEICLSRSEAINCYSASTWHITGTLHEAKGHSKEALKAFLQALDIDPTHVPSLVAVAVVLRQIGCQSPAIVRSYLMEALRHDRTNASAWYNLGLLYKDQGAASALEAAECFEAAVLLEETQPVERFR